MCIPKKSEVLIQRVFLSNIENKYHKAIAVTRDFGVTVLKCDSQLKGHTNQSYEGCQTPTRKNIRNFIFFVPFKSGN